MNTIIYSNLIKQYPGKRTIITGAGSGLGLELTKSLLNDGWAVCALDISVTALENISGSNLFIHQLDVTDRKALKDTVEDFCTVHKGIDILFNNAGVGEGTLFKDYPLENWDWIIDINLKAVIDGTHFILPYMLKENAGIIVNIASMAGIANLPRMSPYNVTKAAVISLSETLNHELSKTNVHVICVAPTFFQSSIMQHSKGDPKVLASAKEKVAGASLTSKEAAHLLLSNLHKGKELIRFPFSAHIFFYFRRLFPFVYKKSVRRFLFKQ